MTHLDFCKLAKASYSKEFSTDYHRLYNGEINDHIQFYLLKRDNAIILAFTGSNETKDWLRHLWVRRHQNMHRGWFADYRRISGLLVSLCHDFKVEELHLTGHSYGCALSCITGHQFGKLGIKVDSIHSFGSPRIGNKEFCNQLDEYVPNHFRVVNRYDSVTKIPFGFGYKHCGQLIKFNTGRHSINDYVSNLEKS